MCQLAVNNNKMKLLKKRDRKVPVIVSIAVERQALRVLNPLGWNLLIAFSFPLYVTFTDVHAGILHFDLNFDLPQITPHQIKAAALKSRFRRTAWTGR